MVREVLVMFAGEGREGLRRRRRRELGKVVLRDWGDRREGLEVVVVVVVCGLVGEEVKESWRPGGGGGGGGAGGGLAIFGFFQDGWMDG